MKVPRIDAPRGAGEHRSRDTFAVVRRTGADPPGDPALADTESFEGILPLALHNVSKAGRVPRSAIAPGTADHDGSPAAAWMSAAARACPPRRVWLAAAALSLLVPGAGQLFNGEPIDGAVWFASVLTVYGLLILSGLLPSIGFVLHLACVAQAAAGPPGRLDG